MISSPVVREAIFLAAPELEPFLKTWRVDPDGRRGRRLERTLVRYLTRLASRPTPFGLFAGNTVGEFGPDTDFTLGPSESYRRHTTLDSDYLMALTERIGEDAAVRESLRYFPNTSLYSAAGCCRYVFTRWQDGVRSFELCSIPESSALTSAIRAAAHGARLKAISQVLQNDLSAAHARAFVKGLIEAQVLVP